MREMCGSQWNVYLVVTENHEICANAGLVGGLNICSTTFLRIERKRPAREILDDAWNLEDRVWASGKSGC